LKNEVLQGLIDPDRVNDTFAEGTASIELIGADCVRFTFYATRNLGEGDVDRQVVARIIAPISAIPNILSQTNAVLAGRPFITASSESAPLQ
jgi:hypothetical protein